MAVLEKAWLGADAPHLRAARRQGSDVRRELRHAQDAREADPRRPRAGLCVVGHGKLRTPRNLAVKIVDPARMSSRDLDRWADASTAKMCHGYVAQVVAEGPHARAKADAWLAESAVALRCTGWTVVAVMAMRDDGTPDAWFTERLAEIEASIRTVPSAQREAMNHAVIAIGCRSAALRRSATAAAKRIGKVEVDHGDTACKTPDAAQYIDKTWAHSTSKGFATPRGARALAGARAHPLLSRATTERAGRARVAGAIAGDARRSTGAAAGVTRGEVRRR